MGKLCHDKNIIGITGGIGSGKSVVSRILRLNGMYVYDCDFEAKRLMEQNGPLRSSLCSLLGNEAYCLDGRLDRKFVASRIFSDSNMLAAVNSLVHAAVKDDFILHAGSAGSGMVFCESAILASSGMAELCDEIWMVTAPEGVRIERVKQRSAIEEEEIRKRMEAQRREFEVYDSLDHTLIENDDEVQLLPEVLRLAGISENVDTYKI